MRFTFQSCLNTFQVVIVVVQDEGEATLRAIKMNSCLICCCSLVVLLLAILGVRWWSECYSHDQEKRHRFGSFSPVREGAVQLKWLVDGQDYMAAVADAIEAADHEIFITDWQIHPHVYMKRPDDGVTSLYWRLDQLLLRKANDSVRIYILLYWETKLAMDLGSDYAISVLSHRNIEIHRHPTHSTPVSHPSTLLRWSHHEKVVVIDRSVAFVGGIDLCFGRWDTHSHELTDNCPTHSCPIDESKCSKNKLSKEKYSRWVGKDYSNTFLIGARTEFEKSQIDYTIEKKDGSRVPLRNEVPRMPWHDVACCFNGEAAMDVAKHFIQRYNAITSSSSWWSYSGQLLSVTDHPKSVHNIPNPSAKNVNIQVLRSVAKWSAEQPQEDSIYRAYLHAIDKAEHFIYIENQFFISSQPKGSYTDVQNQIQFALSERIFRAFKNGEDFHVLIILPLLPEFQEKWDGGDLEAVSYWNYATLYTGENSLFGRLRKKKVPATSLHHYVSVYGLRTHSTLNNKLVTELIYVHSKLMIVDDRVTIIGSANINDRSMVGDRDSEVDVIIEDKEMINGQMNGETFLVGKFSHGLRCHLIKEHLGLLNQENGDFDVVDPVAYNFYHGIFEIATSNTLIYERVFRRKILPTNSVWNYEDLKNWKTFEGLADVFPEGAREEVNKVRGHFVLFPSLFMRDVLKPSALDYFSLYVDTRGQTKELNFNDDKTVFV